MAQSAEITLLRESKRNIIEGFEGAIDIWRHEALKRGVEFMLDHLSRHGAGLWLLERASGGRIEDPRLATSIGSVAVAGPIGLAPGWDKPGRTLAAWNAMGAKHGAVGGVVYWGQPGNPMPRLYTFDQRLGDGGTEISLNSYGFAAPRHEKVVSNLRRQKDAGLIGADVDFPVIVQATLNKEMYQPGNLAHAAHWLAATVRAVKDVADIISLGLSSPNTQGMREAQRNKDFIFGCVDAAIEAAGGKPVVYKGDGDGGESRLNLFCELVVKYGVIMELINTTGKPELKAKYGAENLPGGLAGGDPDYQDMAVAAVRYVFEQTGAEIIGTGGVGVGKPGQAIRLLRAGARVLGVNTGIRRHGAKIMTTVEQEIIDFLDTLPDGQNTLQHIIGADTTRGALA